MKLSVIISTYNSPEWLVKILWGYSCQNFKDFELLVADDGSTHETADLIESIRKEVDFPIKHVWHENKGFRKCEILNKAVTASEADYLVFSDGDCIPRNDFLQTHYEKREPNLFLSGGAVRLPMKLSQEITKEDIKSQKIFQRKWLRKNGFSLSHYKNFKLTHNKDIADVMNKLTPTNPTWNGNNSSTWKEAVLKVNGFDERMRYGAEDREFGVRLIHSGVKGCQVRYNAVLIHLDHERGYVSDEDWAENRRILKETVDNKAVRTKFGISKEEE